MASEKGQVTGLEITARPDSGVDSSPDKDGPSSDVAPKRKKMFQPLKSLRKLFAGKKKGKLKEDGMKPSPSCDVIGSGQDGGSSGQLSSKKSLSADSVFKGDKPRETKAAIELTQSMHNISGAGSFKDELVRKLQVHPRPDDDKGLPASPDPSQPNTSDAIMMNGLKEKSKSMDSDYSLLSMDSSEAEELEEGFFSKEWKKGTRRPISPGSSDGPVDLDVVVSTFSLSTATAKHKILVKPKKQHGQRRKMTSSPKPPGSLPQLKEEAPNRSSGREEFSFTDEGDSSNEKLDMTDEDVEADILPIDDEPETQELTIDLSSDSRSGIQSSSENTPRDEKATETVILRRKKEAEGSNSRPNSESKRDSSKRQTITVGEEITPFGQRKVNRSSLVVDNKNWDELHKTKEQSPENGERSKGTEFHAMFAKFQRGASQKNEKTDKEVPNSDNVKRLSGSSAKEDKDKKQASVKPKLPQTKKPQLKAQDPPKKADSKLSEVQKVEHKKIEPKTSAPLKSRSSKLDHQKPSSKKVDLEKHSSSGSKASPRSSGGEPNEDSGKSKSASSKTAPSETTSSDKVASKVAKSKQESQKAASKPKTVVVQSLSSAEKAGSSSKPNIQTTTKTENSGALKTDKDSAKRNSDTKTDKDSAKRNSDTKTVKTVVVQKSSDSKGASVQHKKSAPTSETRQGDKLPASKPETDPAIKQEPKKVRITEKEKVVESSKSAVTVSNESQRRDSPKPTNRARSQTLPEQLVSKGAQPPSLTDSPSLKRANSQDASVNKENIPDSEKAAQSSSSSEGSPQKSAAILRSAGSGRPEPRRIKAAGSDSQAGQQPTWVKAAKKQTGNWADEGKMDSQQNENTAETPAGKRASVMQLMKKFQS